MKKLVVIGIRWMDLIFRGATKLLQRYQYLSICYTEMCITNSPTIRAIYELLCVTHKQVSGAIDYYCEYLQMV